MPCGCGACGASGPGGCGMGSMPTGGCPTMPTGCPMGGCPMGGCASVDAETIRNPSFKWAVFVEGTYVWPLPSNSDHQDDITFLVGNPKSQPKPLFANGGFKYVLCSSIFGGKDSHF